eukprot:2374675-Pyramimonas_sp.AAC.1
MFQRAGAALLSETLPSECVQIFLGNQAVPIPLSLDLSRSAGVDEGQGPQNGKHEPGVAVYGMATFSSPRYVQLR